MSSGNYPKTKKTMQKLTIICSVINFALLTLFIIFSTLNIISTTIGYMSQLSFLYMLNYPVVYSLPEKRVAAHMQGTVYPSKIKNSSYCQELLYITLNSSVLMN